MDVTIDISPEERTAYEARAASEGLSVEAWLKKLAREHVDLPPSGRSDVRSKTLLELFAPIRGLELDVSRNPSTGRSVDL